jgi:hypothetical protein
VRELAARTAYANQEARVLLLGSLSGVRREVIPTVHFLSCCFEFPVPASWASCTVAEPKGDEKMQNRCRTFDADAINIFNYNSLALAVRVHARKDERKCPFKPL